MKHLKCKISRVLVLYIVLFSSVVTLCLTSIQLYIDYNNGIDTLHQRIEQIKLTNIDSITQSLWTIDYSSLNIQLNGLARINDIIYTELADENNKIITKSGEINTENTITEIIQLTQDYRGTSTTIGELTIVATKENVYQSLIDTVIIILVSQAIKTFLVSAFVLFIFYALVTRHLEKIAAFTEEIKIDSKSNHITLDRRHNFLLKGDELERLVDAINIMSDNIYQSYTDLINSKHMLSEREAKFTAMFDSITDSIVFVDTNRNILQTNTSFEKQFGYNLNELRGKTTEHLYAYPEQYAQQGKKRYNEKADPTPSIYQIDYKRKDGSTFPSETMGGAVTLSDGSLLGYIGIIRDITSRKQSEEENLKLQNQLQQAQKMDAIGQLTGGIAHDFNNILASILGYAELMSSQLDKSADTRLNKYIKHIITGGERARDLVSQLLVFSRAAPGDPHPIYLPDLIEEVISLVKPTIPSSIKLEIITDNDTPEVMMDTTQMHQILMNLCINARDAMHGKGTLSIKLSKEYNEDSFCSSCKKQLKGDYIKLTVSDTGTGINKDILDNIFDPFKSTKAIGEGTGMGLSVVHGILHKHNSHIIVETEAGAGSSFHLLIPPFSKLDHINQKTDSEEKQKEIKVVPSNTTSAHILIVDDESSVAQFMQDLLEEFNYTITTTTSSKKAISLVENSPSEYDLIITDQTMPELSGTEMIKHVLDINPDIPVILSSGYNEQVSKQDAIKLGFSNYLSKPINSKLLIASIEEILQRKV